ncbi:hypothetical protein CEXT_561981 [Caerostris extrusa]|uniref:Uncharacterized protein n=1 Tax=Caerostris extrusa TaxID=172846 RepID=A0AAV4NL71_CAEEX|nr:hypothetical protein CEXT_561981 [Caerostris extrusa]
MPIHLNQIPDIPEAPSKMLPERVFLQKSLERASTSNVEVVLNEVAAEYVVFLSAADNSPFLQLKRLLTRTCRNWEMDDCI